MHRIQQVIELSSNLDFQNAYPFTNFTSPSGRGELTGAQSFNFLTGFIPRETAFPSLPDKRSHQIEVTAIRTYRKPDLQS